MSGAFTGKAPRHWAAEILDGQASLEDVPVAYRDLVQTHIAITEAHIVADQKLIEFWIKHITAGKDLAERRSRLERCPVRIKTQVMEGAKVAWQRRKVNIPDER